MPEITSIPVDQFTSLDPYHYTVDNRPIQGLIERIFIVNAQVDVHDQILTNAIGSAGTLSNRLNQSINDDGTLKATSIDDALHAIAEHLDGGGYVRMTDAERSKLSGIDAQATNLGVQIETISTTVLWPDVGGAVLDVKPSPTITWRFDAGYVYADTTLGITNQIVHHYDVTPVSLGGANYKTTSINTAYKSGTLRIYINGLRITQGPTTIGGYYYTEGTPASGTFSLNTSLTGGHVLRIDFNQPIA